MCDYYQTATGPEIRDLVFPGLEVLGQSNSLEKKRTCTNGAYVRQILNKLKKMTNNNKI